MAHISDHPSALPPHEAPRGSLAAGLHAARAKWGWFVALGAILVIAGLIALANLLVSTVVTILYVGALMLVAGIAEIVHAFQVKTWGKFVFWMLAGILYVVAGALTAYNPLLASAIITLMLGVSLLVSGIFRMVAGFSVRPDASWTWLVLGGLVTTLLGAMIMAHWPLNSLWVLGMFLGIDMVFNGFAILMLGMRLKPRG